MRNTHPGSLTDRSRVTQCRHSLRPTRLRRLLILVSLVSVCLTTLIVGPNHATMIAGRPQAANSSTGPTLISAVNATRAIALDSVTMLPEPFALTEAVSFGADNRTRVMLFATNLGLAPGEGAAAVSAEAEDGALLRYPLAVEYAGTVPGYDWMYSVIVRLNDDLGNVGDVLVGITVHGLTSNRVRIGVGHVGGGPPDDPTPTPTPTPTPSATPTPAPMPDLGTGASLHGKQVF